MLLTGGDAVAIIGSGVEAHWVWWHMLIRMLCNCRSQEGFNFEAREVKEAVKLLDKNGDG